MSQLLLLPATAPQVRRESLPLDAIDGFADATPSAKLRELIRDLGLLQPVVVVSSGSSRYELVEGRRRCKAISELSGEGHWPAPPHVEALILAQQSRFAGRCAAGWRSRYTQAAAHRRPVSWTRSRRYLTPAP